MPHLDGGPADKRSEVEYTYMNTSNAHIHTHLEQNDKFKKLGCVLYKMLLGNCQ